MGLISVIRRDKESITPALAKTIRESLAFRDFLPSVDELSDVRLLPLTHPERLSFFINAYNLLMLHTVIVTGKSRSNYKYILGQLGAVSADQIEHACLRGPLNKPL